MLRPPLVLAVATAVLFVVAPVGQAGPLRIEAEAGWQGYGREEDCVKHETFVTFFDGCTYRYLWDTTPGVAPQPAVSIDSVAVFWSEASCGNLYLRTEPIPDSSPGIVGWAEVCGQAGQAETIQFQVTAWTFFASASPEGVPMVRGTWFTLSWHGAAGPSPIHVDFLSGI